MIAELGGEGVLTPASWGMFSLRLPPLSRASPAEDRAVLMEALADLAEHAAGKVSGWLSNR